MKYKLYRKKKKKENADKAQSIIQSFIVHEQIEVRSERKGKM